MLTLFATLLTAQANFLDLQNSIVCDMVVKPMEAGFQVYMDDGHHVFGIGRQMGDCSYMDYYVIEERIALNDVIMVDAISQIGRKGSCVGPEGAEIPAPPFASLSIHEEGILLNDTDDGCKMKWLMFKNKISLPKVEAEAEEEVEAEKE